MKKSVEKASPPGLIDDPVHLKVLTEIDMIAHMASLEFERLLPAGVTSAQYGVLNRALRLGTDETISELAAAFQVSQPTMSSTVRKLEDKGLVLLKPDPEDRRVKRVCITAEGKKLRRQVVRSLEPYYRTFDAEAPDMDWATLLTGLTQLRSYFERRK